MADDPIHVVFDLPSGSRADFTFYNRHDANYVFTAIKEHAKRVGAKPPAKIQYMSKQED